VIIGWVAVLALVAGLGAANPATYSNDIDLPGAQSHDAAVLLESRFPAQAGDVDQIVLHSPDSKLTEPATAQRIERMLGEVKGLPHVTGVTNPFSAESKGQISKDGKIAFATVTFDESAREIPKPAIQRMMDTARSVEGDGLQVEMGGQAIQVMEQTTPGAAELIGLAAAMLILLLTFGSVVAMGLPILTALFGLGVGLSLLGLLSHTIDTADFAPQLATMIGLGVGIDYALFIVSRFRDAFAENGQDLEGAVVTSLDTAGRSVLFAGLTVVISILGMVLLGISFLYGVAVATSVVVAITVLAALTLTPALLRFDALGGRIGRHRINRRGAEREGLVWARWSDAVVKRRWLCAIGGTALLVALTVPAFSMRQLHNDAGNGNTSTTTRQAYDLLAKGFGPGFNGPIKVVATLPAGGGSEAVAAIRSGIASTPGIAQTTGAEFSPDGRVAVITAFASSKPQAAETTDLVDRLRSEVTPPLAKQTNTEILIGGFTPATVDLADIFGRKLPLFISVVVALSALLLMVVFRSILVPIKAAAMNLLSIGAALGVVTLVFQEGWGAGLLGIEPGPIEPFLPVMMFAIIFGLSMDYEVFIVSRIREEWSRSGDPRDAVRRGLAATGRVVTAAAAIMIFVFASFMLGGDKIIKMFGLGLATAVFIDAFLIRVILLPAVMDLAANATWWLPKWLDRLLPRVGIEGPAEGHGQDDLAPADSARA
jgi:RND superfamily putative drug exporter